MTWKCDSQAGSSEAGRLEDFSQDLREVLFFEHKSNLGRIGQTRSIGRGEDVSMSTKIC